MPSVTITIDGNTVMDGDLGQWTTEPPEILTEQLKANARPAPWMRALMLTLADASMNDQSTTTIDVHTRAGGWTLDVQET